MPQKRKTSAARVANLQVARDTLSGKQRKSTPVDSDFSDEKHWMMGLYGSTVLKVSKTTTVLVLHDITDKQ